MPITPLFNQENRLPEQLERSFRILHLLAKSGIPKTLLAELLHRTVGKRLRTEQEAFLIAPLIVHQSPWMEDIPAWMVQNLTADRLRVLQGELTTGHTSQRVGYVELAAVLYPATMEAPLRFTAAQIYLWASAQARAEHREQPVERIWEGLGMRKIEDRDIHDPNGAYHQDYQNLCAEIRRKVTAAGMKRVRERKKEIATGYENKTQPSDQGYSNRVDGMQLDLF